MRLYAAVAQTGRAPDSMKVEGEAEDRVVAGSSPARGTTELSLGKEPARRMYARAFLRGLEGFLLEELSGSRFKH